MRIACQQERKQPSDLGLLQAHIYEIDASCETSAVARCVQAAGGDALRILYEMRFNPPPKPAVGYANDDHSLKIICVRRHVKITKPATLHTGSASDIEVLVVRSACNPDF